MPSDRYVRARANATAFTTLAWKRRAALSERPCVFVARASRRSEARTRGTKNLLLHLLRAGVNPHVSRFGHDYGRSSSPKSTFPVIPLPTRAPYHHYHRHCRHGIVNAAATTIPASQPGKAAWQPVFLGSSSPSAEPRIHRSRR